MTEQTRPETPSRANVLIVGFGPVGKLLALKLGRYGHDVIVVDRQHTGYPLPRAVTHCSDFARIMQSVGLAPDTIPAITQPYDAMYVWRNGAGQTLVEVDWSGRGESGWYNTYFFHQPSLEAALDEIIEQLPNVHVMRGWEALNVQQAAGSATVTLQDTETGLTRDATASWIVGADGANSHVRHWAAIEWHDEGYFYDWLVVDVKPHPELDFPHVATQLCDTRRPSTMVPGGPGRRRWEFMRLPHETPEQLNQTGMAWKLVAPFGVTPSNADLERHSVYTFQACWATEWRAGRVLLVGDAAHLMPPFAGQGLGAGVRDVMNLAWKLDAVLRGMAPDQLLDTYGSERRHHAVAFVRFSMDLGKVICISDPDEAADRDARMVADWSAGRPPPAPPRPGLGDGVHEGAAGGRLARQGLVGIGGRAMLFDDAFGGPGALMARRAAHLAELSDDVRVALADLGVRLVAFGGTEGPGVSVVQDVDGVYADWMDELDADVVLIRPDFHLYGATSAGDVERLSRAFLSRVGYRHPTRSELARGPSPAE